MEAIASREMTEHGLHGWTFGLANTKRRLGVCKNFPPSKLAIIAGLGYDKMTGNVWKALQRLTELKLIELTIPAKPNSKNQKRRITQKGLHALSDNSQ